jgi:hypothetical protein
MVKSGLHTSHLHHWLGRVLFYSCCGMDMTKVSLHTHFHFHRRLGRYFREHGTPGFHAHLAESESSI